MGGLGDDAEPGDAGFLDGVNDGYHVLQFDDLIPAQKHGGVPVGRLQDFEAAFQFRQIHPFFFKERVTGFVDLDGMDLLGVDGLAGRVGCRDRHIDAFFEERRRDHEDDEQDERQVQERRDVDFAQGAVRGSLAESLHGTGIYRKNEAQRQEACWTGFGKNAATSLMRLESDASN